MAARKLRDGSLLRISLGDGTDAFARVLPNSQLAIYSHREPHDAHIEPSIIYGAPVLWKLTVMKSAFISGRWPMVGQKPLEPDLAAPIEYFIRDQLTGRYSVYRSTDGHTRPGTYEECKTMEAAAVWEPEHIEDRLRDYFSGRPNVWVEQLKAVP